MINLIEILTSRTYMNITTAYHLEPNAVPASFDYTPLNAILNAQNTKT
jgi:hypothetical protein